MDWLIFLSTNIKSLAWPVAVVAVVLVLKHDVRALLRSLGPRLRKFKVPFVELTFGQVVDEVEPKVHPEDTNVITDAKHIENVSALTRLPPPYIVSQAWLRLEQAIRKAVDKKLSNEPAAKRRLFAYLLVNEPAEASARRLFAYLKLGAVQGSILPQEDIDVLRELRRLRNRAAHSVDPDITTITDALRYNDIANSLIQKIALSATGFSAGAPTLGTPELKQNPPSADTP